MLDLIKEGIKNSEKLFKLPFRAIKEITGESSKTMAELENLAGTPFRLANQAVDALTGKKPEPGRPEAEQNNSWNQDNLEGK